MATANRVRVQERLAATGLLTDARALNVVASVKINRTRIGGN